MTFECAPGNGWHSRTRLFEHIILLLVCKDNGVLGAYSRRFGRREAKGFTSGPLSSVWVRSLIDPENLRLIAHLTICFQRSREESKYEQAAEDFAYGQDAQAKVGMYLVMSISNLLCNFTIFNTSASAEILYPSILGS
jgi:hypothetical protein